MKKHFIKTMFLFIIFIFCIDNLYSFESKIILVGNQSNLTFSCEQNYPNPMANAGGWWTSFTLPETCLVSISILDTSLTSIYDFQSKELRDGDYQFWWNYLDGKDKTVPSGFYYFQLTAKSTKLNSLNEYSCRFKFIALLSK